MHIRYFENKISLYLKYIRTNDTFVIRFSLSRKIRTILSTAAYVYVFNNTYYGKLGNT